VTSGIFIDREAATWSALEGAGFELVRRWQESDWVAFEAVRAG
jgi:ribosomal protein L11 methylase PrmA